jgi:hypothetical protein
MLDPLKRPPTLKELHRAWMGLQAVIDHVPRRLRGKVHFAMDAIDGTARDLRRKAIFAAGARARNPHCKFEGDDLGSIERMRFFDGYASTHPGFKNPYHGE